jgi:hypothetical protein
MALTTIINTGILHKDVPGKRVEATNELKDKIDNWGSIAPGDKDEIAKLMAYILFLLVRETTGHGQEASPDS